ncbi:MAG TPA: nucleoside triphosphate pyrophosphohydrolase [Chthonomonadaceae bacterium]|nr:nucleoside triphosphate pyrophosphohydrolase [Chthonomonadaceae bacterium]
MITLIGLGAGDADTLSRGAERALQEASLLAGRGEGALFVRTERHPSVHALRDWGLTFETFDSLYDCAPDFTTVYTALAEHVLAEAGRVLPDGGAFPVAYAVPGHPLFGEESVRLVIEGAQANGIPTRIVSSGSFVEAALTAAGVSLGDGCDVRDALTLSSADTVDAAGQPDSGRLDVSRGLLLYQVFDLASASHAKLALMRDYPDDWPILHIRWAGVADRETVHSLPLYRLDREPVDHLTAIYVPPLPPSRRRAGFGALVGIMARLRAPGGCPWDREQSHETLRKYFIEETYEVIEAIDAGDPDLLCEELGDALLQVVFHAQLAAEEGSFRIDDVTEHIVRKLIRRHPHVFGAVEVSGSEEVLRNWEQIKRAEKGEPDAKEPSSVLDGVPRGLPALMQAMEISKRVVKLGFEWPDFAGVLDKLEEESAELKTALALPAPDRKEIESELGDLLFTIVQIARWQKIDPEEALRAMLARFSARFRYMERRAREQDRPLAGRTLEELDSLWKEAKAQNRRGMQL